jgi:hypothetical protein
MREERVVRWQPTVRQRVAVGVVGLVLVLVGMGAWSIETEYGGNAVGGSELSGGVTRVFDIDERSVDAQGHPVTTIVFEGTEAEAEAFMTRRWNEGRNYLIPGSVFGFGILVFLAAFVPPLGRRK